MAALALIFLLYCFYTVLQPTLYALGDRLADRVFPARHAGFSSATSPVKTPSEATASPEPEITFDLPKGIVAYAKSWGQDWVEASVIERAKALYVQHRNWDTVYQELLEQDGETK